MTPPLIIFSLLAAITLGAAFMVIIAKNPVHAALFLVLAFVATAGIWMLLEAEFLSLILVLVYVGAVMTLFLFVVMMINLDHLPRQNLKRYLPIAIVLGAVLIWLILFSLETSHFPAASQLSKAHSADYSNVKAIGAVLYTDYVYAFELASIILLAAIIASISLVHRQNKSPKKQKIEKQIATTRAESIKLVKIVNRPAETQ
jgi:NADH-quinone oxidoreductase subunit J